MALYGTPLEPGLNLSVITDTQVQVTSPQTFNSAYMLIEAPAASLLEPNKVNLITSLTDYRNKVGGVPTTYQQLVDYLSVSAFLDNAEGNGLLQVIPVLPPSAIQTLTVSPITLAGETSLAYSLTINAQVLQGAVALAATDVPAERLAKEIATRIAADPILSTVIYVRQVLLNTVEIAPLVSGTAINWTFANVSVTNPSVFNVPQSQYVLVQNPPVGASPTVIDYGQTIYTAIKDELPLGFIIAPGFIATSTAKTAFEFATIADNFCRLAKKQHLVYLDVPNPDSKKVPLYATVANYASGQVLANAALTAFNGDILEGQNGGLLAVAPAVAAAVVALNARVLLPQSVTFKGATAKVVQSIDPAAAIAILTAPTNAELQKFVPIPDSLLIAEGLAAGKLKVKEKSTATESGLYNWRDEYNSLEGHVSAVGPYQKYNGLEVVTPFVIPASAYLASLHIRVAANNGLATPPASDGYPLRSTAGPIWEVTSAGHALLNGKGVNIIKTINNAVYIMGSRTLSKQDLYNRINNRAILSAYVRTMILALSSGIVLRALDSTGTQLASIKAKMDTVSEAFYRVGYFDGITSGDAYRNSCSNLNNPAVQLQQGIVNAKSEVTQIGMIEKLVVTIQERLLGT